MLRPLQYISVFVRSLPVALDGLFVSGTKNAPGFVNDAFDDHLAGSSVVSRGARVRAIIAAGYRNQSLNCHSSFVMLSNSKKKSKKSRRNIKIPPGASLPLRTPVTDPEPFAAHGDAVLTDYRTQMSHMVRL